jgi:hypothetical protein
MAGRPLLEHSLPDSPRFGAKAARLESGGSGFSGRYTKVNRCLSEGCRRFADRLAGIESGAECDRLAPQLSALADGEADAEDMAVLRRHLRTCLMCRARLRDYRDAPARVAAFAPPVAAGGLLAGARDLLAALVMRWHHGAELTAAHKLAAVAASTAALAGGGAVTVATFDGGDRPAAVLSVPGSSVVQPPLGGNESVTPRGTTTSSRGAPGPAGSRGEPAADRDPARNAHPAGESNPPAASTGEFTPDPGPAKPAGTKKPEQLARPADPALSGGEFAP